MLVKDEGKRKVGVFRGHRERRWTARIHFPDGKHEDHKLMHTDKQKAMMAGVVIWKMRMREKGLEKKQSGSLGVKKAVSRLPDDAEDLLPFPPFSESLLSSYVAAEKLRLEALEKVGLALVGLATADVCWIVEKVRHAFNIEGFAEEPSSKELRSIA